jgi:hypothetical protein
VKLHEYEALFGAPTNRRRVLKGAAAVIALQSAEANAVIRESRQRSYAAARPSLCRRVAGPTLRRLAETMLHIIRSCLKG